MKVSFTASADYRYKGVSNKENPLKKSKIRQLVLNVATRCLRLLTNPGAVYWSADKERQARGREELRMIGGEEVKITSIDGKNLNGMFLSADKFKQNIEAYFEKKVGKDGGEYLALKEEFGSLGVEDDEFESMKNDEARKFCKTLASLSLLQTNHEDHEDRFFLHIPLNKSSITNTSFSGKRPVVLMCYPGPMSYVAYRDESVSYLMKGLDVMVFDYEGAGKSKGQSTDYNMKLATDSFYQYLKNKGMKNKEIIAHGFCMGAGAATDLAARRKGVHVVVDRSFTSVAQMAEDKHPRLYRILSPIIPKVANFDNEANLPRVKGHIAILKGKDDEFIPKTHAKKNYNSAKTSIRPKQIVRKIKVENVSHFDNSIKDNKELDRFLKKARLLPGIF